MELIQRPRRLRGNDAVRRLCRETRMSPDSLIYPIFVDETLQGVRPIEALPGQNHYGIDSVCQAVEECLAAGVNHCILFGLPAHKDAIGSSAWDENGVVQQAIRAIKAKYPDFYVITDVCMCEYTDHGHCGILCGHEVDNGNHRMQPGTYDYTVERDGFVAAAGTIEVSNDAPAKLYVCLDTTEATAGWYDDDSTADADACQQVLDYQMFENEQAWLDTDPILRVIPYHSYDKGFNIDYAVDEAGGFTVSITPLSCNAQRADSLYEAALDYLRSQDIDPDDYAITRKNGCE